MSESGPYRFDEEPYCVTGPGGVEVYGDIMNHGLANTLNVAYSAGRASRDEEVMELVGAVRPFVKGGWEGGGPPRPGITYQDFARLCAAVKKFIKP